MSDLDQFEDALGQFLVYLFALTKKEPDRVLFLAVPALFYETFFDDPFLLNWGNIINLKLSSLRRQNRKL